MGSSVTHAFLDESGNPDTHIGKRGTGRYYVICAVTTPIDSIESTRAAAHQIREQYFQSGEMKSNKVGKNRRRRLAILRELTQLPVHFCALVVDKREINPDSGLNYKRPFIMWLFFMLFDYLTGAHRSLNAYLDAHGSEKFMESFRDYSLHRSRDLFKSFDVIRVDSKEEVLVQVADMIAGTIGRYLEDKDDSAAYELLATLKPVYKRWPYWTRDDRQESLFDSTHDKMIGEQGVELTLQYIQTNEAAAEEEERTRIKCLYYLLERYQLYPTEYTPTHKLLDHLNNGREEWLTERAFRQQVIGALRSAGVIVTSSSNGYKLPHSKSDMYAFVRKVDGQVIPYLNRLNMVRQRLLLTSSGDYDIVEGFGQLKACLDSINNPRISTNDAD